MATFYWQDRLRRRIRRCHMHEQEATELAVRQMAVMCQSSSLIKRITIKQGCAKVTRDDTSKPIKSYQTQLPPPLK